MYASSADWHHTLHGFVENFGERNKGKTER